MDYISMTDDAVASEVGRRLKTLRLRQNLTQDKLAHNCGLSLNTIKKIEKGLGKLTNIIAVLRALNALEEIDRLLAEPQVSPMELLRNKNKPRQRARIRTTDGTSTKESAGNLPVDGDLAW